MRVAVRVFLTLILFGSAGLMQPLHADTEPSRTNSQVVSGQ
jgi:hypothetical protein